MFLNETNPPLEEALEHHGIKGMHWGRHKARDSSSSEPMHDTNYDYYDPQRHDATKRKIAIGILVGAGTVATVALLRKNGTLKVPSLRSLDSGTQGAGSRGSRAYEAYKKSKFANKTFRPENVGNPLFTKNPKAASDFIDAGFGKNGVFNVTTMSKGAKTVNDFGPEVWQTPLRAITSGR